MSNIKSKEGFFGSTHLVFYAILFHNVSWKQDTKQPNQYVLFLSSLMRNSKRVTDLKQVSNIYASM